MEVYVVKEEFKGTMSDYNRLEPLASVICYKLFPNLYPPTEKYNIKGIIIRELFKYDK